MGLTNSSGDCAAESEPAGKLSIGHIVGVKPNPLRSQYGPQDECPSGLPDPDPECERAWGGREVAKKGEIMVNLIITQPKHYKKLRCLIYVPYDHWAHQLVIFRWDDMEAVMAAMKDVFLAPLGQCEDVHVYGVIHKNTNVVNEYTGSLLCLANEHRGVPAYAKRFQMRIPDARREFFRWLEDFRVKNHEIYYHSNFISREDDDSLVIILCTTDETMRQFELAVRTHRSDVEVVDIDSFNDELGIYCDY